MFLLVAFALGMFLELVLDLAYGLVFAFQTLLLGVVPFSFLGFLLSL